MTNLHKLKESEAKLTSHIENQSEIASSSEEVATKKSEKERETWGSGLDFFFSCLGYAVGIGNVWRFPYLCYRNGGGAYLIPYFTCMFVLAIPMVYLEFVVGQFTSAGPLTSFKMVRISRGIGLSINFANFYFTVFFQMIIAYAFYFLIASFSYELPWSKCNPAWMSPNCVDDFSADKFTYTTCEESSLLKCDELGTANFGRCFMKKLNSDGSQLASCSMNASMLQQVGYWKTSFPSADYWNKIVLQKTDSIEETGSIVWKLAGSLFCIYLIVYFMMIKGIKVSGKAVYFTTSFPYLVLLILGIKAWRLPGAMDGIKFYVTPDWSRLFDIHVWSEAASAIFFSISISYGGMTTLASYNKFNADIKKIAFLIPLANCLTSFFAGFVVFAYMGYLSHITGQKIDNIIEAGQGLAYVVYPYAVTTLQGGPFWAVAFFLMLILLGISSTVGAMEVTITSVLDGIKPLSRTSFRKYVTITCVFIMYFILGLLFCMQSGTYWMEVFNNYSGDWAILIVGALECIIVSYLYGIKNFIRDIKIMNNQKELGKSIYIWSSLWCVISPAMCIGVSIFALYNLKNIQVGSYTFPDWTLYLGQCMQAVLIVSFFAYAVYAVIKAMLKNESILSLFQPDFESYVPKLYENVKLVRLERGLEETENYSSIIESNNIL